ncbi:PREDICTED: uncharacterized protein LOC109354000 [Lupinus angustifolius]|uniref:uncharacterized protein LOC109354000 n=1 Tax=Lupinus angustifolius TaxID=3871 RepID=UPI00092EDEDA|nr:PREDICTED: uncharacterized protein LOC109354000 [Lupinus angustifolius]
MAFSSRLKSDSKIRGTRKVTSSPPKKSFVPALRNTCDFSTSQLPQPCIKGDSIAIKIPEAYYQEGIKRCKTHLHGRLIMSKGDTPLKFTNLISKLVTLWNMIGKWSMVSLGKGFYEFSFTSLEDMSMICAIGSWNLKPRILFSIAGGIGTPISLDEATHNRTFGHFAKVLVELNLKSNLPDQILVERDSFAFFVAIEYENLPAFCHQCQAIGHTEFQCRKNSNAKADDTGKQRVRKPPTEEVEKKHDTPHMDKGEMEIKISDLVIDLEVERNDNLLGMVRPESPKDMNQITDSPGSSEGIHTSVEENEVNQSDNAIIQETAEIANHVAANDMRIIGKLWANDEECSEEETFTTVLSKSKKKKLKRRSNTEKIHYTRKGGFGNPKSRLVLKNICTTNKPNLVFLAEPMIHIDVVDLSFWNSINLKIFAANERLRLSPSLWGLCRLDMDPTVLRVSTQHFSISVMKDNRGSSLPNITSCNEIKSFFDENLLINIPTIGTIYTWTNRRLGAANTERRLDRAICNDDWINNWSQVCCCSLPRLASNNWSQVSCCSLPRLASVHHPLLLNLGNDNSIRPSSFRFHKIWLQNEDCKRLVSHSWHTRVFGCPMYILAQKLTILKHELKYWNKTVFGNIHHKVILAKNNVEHIQNCIRDSDPSTHLYQQEDLAQSELLKALIIEEIFWKEKARINWHNYGDRNITYFHKMAKIKHVTKAMSLIKSGDVLLTDHDAIGSHVLDYYTNLFASPNFVTSKNLIQEVIPSLVNEADNLMISSIPSDVEIKSVVFDMNEDSAHGPDGYGGEGSFYTNFWDIISMDVCKSVRQFFQQKWLMPNLNSSNVILIPKMQGA